MNAKKTLSDHYSIALVAILCLSFLALPLGVHAFPQAARSSDPALQGYQSMGNGVFESTFTRNVGGIQGATHVIVLTPTGIRISGWI
jgi:hypothetical protein